MSALAPPTIGAPSRRPGRSVPAGRRGGRLQPRWAGWGFIGPFAVAFAFVFLAPIGYSLYLSVYKTRLIGGTRFVGIDNYREALTDEKFWGAFGRVALFLCVQVPIMLVLALLIALAIDSGRLHGKSFFRVTVFLPYAVPAVVATLMWGFMYGSQFGLVKDINRGLGMSLPDPLSTHLVLASIGNVVTWEYVGYNMLIFYSALQVVPRSLYEAARIDGASELRLVTAIKLPAIRGALLIATIFSIIGTFQLFNEPSILRPLTPNAITTFYTPNLYAYSLSFAGQQYNYAATVAIIMAVLTMIVAYAVQLRGMRGQGVGR